MERDTGDRTILFEDDAFVIDIEDGDLERAAAGDGRQAITWAYCTSGWYGCRL